MKHPIPVFIILFVSTTLLHAESSGTKTEATIDQAEEAVETAVKNYPLTTCIVSDEPLGAMGDAVEFDHAGQTIKFCCKSCVRKFKKDPAKYLAKLTEGKASDDSAEAGASDAEEGGADEHADHDHSGHSH